jgi:hypothetical protein
MISRKKIAALLLLASLACSSAPHPSDPQPPNSVKGPKTDIPTLLSADILALLLQARFGHRVLWNLKANW